MVLGKEGTKQDPGGDMKEWVWDEQGVLQRRGLLGSRGFAKREGFVRPRNKALTLLNYSEKLRSEKQGLWGCLGFVALHGGVLLVVHFSNTPVARLQLRGGVMHV